MLELDQLIAPDLFFLAIEIFLTQLFNDFGSLLELLLKKAHEKSGYITLNAVGKLQLGGELSLFAA